MYPHDSPSHEHHVHYHYHYHYEPPEPRSLHAPSRPASKVGRELSPRTYCSSIETNYWKQHVNPEVSRLYHSIHPRRSRFSENNRISEEDSIVEDVSPAASKNRLLETQCGEDTTFGEPRPLSKLESLYYSKQPGRAAEEVESIASDPEDAFFSVHEAKLRGYRREIDRLRRI